MRRILLALFMVFALVGFAQAQETEDDISLTFPMETGVTAFWFPDSGTFAGGMTHTVARVSLTQLPDVSLDLDATIAQEFNDDRDTMYGLGLKVNLNVTDIETLGLEVLPNIGVTALNDFAGDDFMGGFQVAVYGTLLMYKW